MIMILTMGMAGARMRICKMNMRWKPKHIESQPGLYKEAHGAHPQSR